MFIQNFFKSLRVEFFCLKSVGQIVSLSRFFSDGAKKGRGRPPAKNLQIATERLSTELLVEVTGKKRPGRPSTKNSQAVIRPLKEGVMPEVKSVAIGETQSISGVSIKKKPGRPSKKSLQTATESLLETGVGEGADPQVFEKPSKRKPGRPSSKGSKIAVEQLGEILSSPGVVGDAPPAELPSDFTSGWYEVQTDVVSKKPPKKPGLKLKASKVPLEDEVESFDFEPELPKKEKGSSNKLDEFFDIERLKVLTGTAFGSSKKNAESPTVADPNAPRGSTFFVVPDKVKALRYAPKSPKKFRGIVLGEKPVFKSAAPRFVQFRGVEGGNIEDKHKWLVGELGFVRTMFLKEEFVENLTLAIEFFRSSFLLVDYSKLMRDSGLDVNLRRRRRDFFIETGVCDIHTSDRLYLDSTFWVVGGRLSAEYYKALRRWLAKWLRRNLLLTLSLKDKFESKESTLLLKPVRWKPLVSAPQSEGSLLGKTSILEELKEKMPGVLIYTSELKSPVFMLEALDKLAEKDVISFKPSSEVLGSIVPALSSDRLADEVAVADKNSRSFRILGRPGQVYLKELRDILSWLRFELGGSTSSFFSLSKRLDTDRFNRTVHGAEYTALKLSITKLILAKLEQLKGIYDELIGEVAVASSSLKKLILTEVFFPESSVDKESFEKLVGGYVDQLLTFRFGVYDFRPVRPTAFRNLFFNFAFDLFETNGFKDIWGAFDKYFLNGVGVGFLKDLSTLIESLSILENFISIVNLQFEAVSHDEKKILPLPGIRFFYVHAKSSPQESNPWEDRSMKPAVIYEPGTLDTISDFFLGEALPDVAGISEEPVEKAEPEGDDVGATVGGHTLFIHRL